MALVGKGEMHREYRVYDIVFLCFTSDHLSLLLLVRVHDSTQPWFSFNSFHFQVVVLSMAGKYVDAMSCIVNLITDGWVDPVLYVVQAHETYTYIQ